MHQQHNGNAELYVCSWQTFVLRLGHRGSRLLHHAARAGLFRLLRRALCGSHQGIWLEPRHHLPALFRRSGGVRRPDLALWPALRPLWAAPVVSVWCAMSGSWFDHQRAGAHALASVSDLGTAGQPGHESEWFRPPPDANGVVVPPAPWSCLRPGAQRRQHRHAGVGAGYPVSGQSLRLASGLHGVRPTRHRLSGAPECALATSLPGGPRAVP